METKKIVIIGDANVGKTSFVRKLQGQEMPLNHAPTLGVEVIPIRRNETCFNVWDCSGSYRLRGLGDGYWVKADGAIIMADCSNSETILTIESWRTQLRRIIEDKPIIVVLNKCEILSKEQRDLLEKVLPDVIFISCKENVNIEKVLNSF